MFSKIKSYFPIGNFTKNVLTLMSGTIIAQALPIGITPVLTRIYTPDDFGVLALFLGITAITGAISNAKYEQSIVLAKTDNEAINLLFLGVIIAFAISLILLFVIIFFNAQIVQLLGDEKIKNWLYFVPISTLFLGIFNTLNLYNIRKKKFKNISISQVTKSSSSGIIQVLVGIFQNGPFGLIIGQILSYISGNSILFKTLNEKKNIKKVINNKDVKRLANEYINFPKFSMPSIFLNSLNLNITKFLISSIFSITTLGFYSLTERVISIPSSVIRNNFSQVYFQKATEEYYTYGTTQAIFLKSLKKLILIALPIFALLYLISEYIFGIFFGNEWTISGTYAKILIPLALIRFISGAFSITLSIHAKQKYSLVINIILFSTTMTIFYLGRKFSIDFENLLKIFVYILSIEYFLFLIFYWKISRNK